MAVKIDIPPPSKGLFGSKIFGLGLAALSGGAGAGLLGGTGALGALGGAGVAAATQANPQIGKLANAYGTAKGMAEQFKPNPGHDQASSTLATDSNFKMPKLGESAMSRRMGSYQLSPNTAIQSGLEALKDPSIPDYMRQQYATPLLQAKHFGGSRR